MEPGPSDDIHSEGQDIFKVFEDAKTEGNPTVNDFFCLVALYPSFRAQRYLHHLGLL